MIDKAYIQSNFADWQKYLKTTFHIASVQGVTTDPSIDDQYSHNGNVYRVAEVDLTSGNGTIKLAYISGDSNSFKASGNLTRVSGVGDVTIAFIMSDEKEMADDSQIDKCLSDAFNEVSQAVTIDFESEYPSFVDLWVFRLTQYNIVAAEQYFDRLRKGMPIFDNAMEVRETLKMYKNGDLSLATPSEPDEDNSGLGIHISSKDSFYKDYD